MLIGGIICKNCSQDTHLCKCPRTDEEARQLAEKEDTSTLERLNKLLEEKEKQKVNLFDSLKICDIDSVRKSIFEEIAKIEEGRQNLEQQIQIENSKRVNLDEKEVKFFLKQIRSGDVNDIKYGKMLVNVLINKLYLYDDNVTIFFNTQGKEYSSKVPTIEEVEVRIKDTPAHQSVSVLIDTLLF